MEDIDKKGLRSMEAVKGKRMMVHGWLGRTAVLATVVAIGLAVSGVALGATSTAGQGKSAASDQYGIVVKSEKAVKVTNGSPTQPATVATSSGTLPFTGVSLIWPGIAALGMVGFGVALRRHERKG